jgi:CXXX repeat peptide maturase
MLKYLIIQLDDVSVSYCHYDNPCVGSNLMPLATLKEGIVFAMKHNLHIQYILPPHNLPDEYMETISSYPHDNIGPFGHSEHASVIVATGISELTSHTGSLSPSKRYVLRTTVGDFLKTGLSLKGVFSAGISVNIVFTDVDSFTDNMIREYEDIIRTLSSHIVELTLNGISVNSNILTDRVVLKEMNNCGAGETSIALAPDGNLYPCPAFYIHREEYFSATLENPVFRNSNLFTLNHSPLCRGCDAYHCKRCVWLNRKLTYEINTPSHQQCVMSHIERNISKEILESFHSKGILTDISIPEIDYLDPFDNFQNT